jgi:hypothetical protein
MCLLGLDTHARTSESSGLLQRCRCELCAEFIDRAARSISATTVTTLVQQWLDERYDPNTHRYCAAAVRKLGIQHVAWAYGDAWVYKHGFKRRDTINKACSSLALSRQVSEEWRQALQSLQR